MYTDEHAGHGGSYLLDPKTGKRELKERTDHTPKPEVIDPPTRRTNPERGE